MISSMYTRRYLHQASCDIMSIQQNIFISAKLLTVGNYGNIIRVHEKDRYHLHYGRRILHSGGGCQETESLGREDQIHAEKESVTGIQNWQPMAYRPQRPRRLLGTAKERPRRQKIKADFSHYQFTVARVLLAVGSAIAAPLDHATLVPIITCYFADSKSCLNMCQHVSAKRIIGAWVARRVYLMSTKQEDYSIYVLIDPRDNQVRYVGRTTNLEHRYKQHLVPINGSTLEKKNWIQELRQLGLQPLLSVIDSADNRVDASAKETYWIHHYTQTGAILLNQPCVAQREWEKRIADWRKTTQEEDAQ